MKMARQPSIDKEEDEPEEEDDAKDPEAALFPQTPYVQYFKILSACLHLFTESQNSRSSCKCFLLFASKLYRPLLFIRLCVGTRVPFSLCPRLPDLSLLRTRPPM